MKRTITIEIEAGRIDVKDSAGVVDASYVLVKKEMPVCRECALNNEAVLCGLKSDCLGGIYVKV